jgi:hypothetical protein
MSIPLLTRATRMSRTVSYDGEILKAIQSPEARTLLARAAAQGIMPLNAISELLLARLGPEAFKERRALQYCGTVARAVLAEEGFEVAQANVRVRGDPLFKSGAIYHRVSDAPPAPAPLIIRLLDTLSLDEAEAARVHLENRIKAMRSRDPAAPAPYRREGRK